MILLSHKTHSNITYYLIIVKTRLRLQTKHRMLFDYRRRSIKDDEVMILIVVDAFTKVLPTNYFSQLLFYVSRAGCAR